MHREPNKKKDSPLPVFTKKENATLARASKFWIGTVLMVKISPKLQNTLLQYI
jgi:hypothetical protein